MSASRLPVSTMGWGPALLSMTWAGTVRGTGVSRALVLVCLIAAPMLAPAPQSHEALVEVIVQGTTLARAAEAVRGVGGTVTDTLPIIEAVSATLPETALPVMRAQPGVRRVWRNLPVRAVGGKPGTSGSTLPDTAFPRVMGAPDLWAKGITGKDITVAVVDTGAAINIPGIAKNTAGRSRVLAYFDAIRNAPIDPTRAPADAYGHGSHVSGIIGGSQLTAIGQYAGLAPDAGLVIVRALGDSGVGSYVDVIRGIDWVVANQGKYNIRVLNLSLSAPPQSYYWDDPLNQAVMKAWQTGIVVVAAAGNTGPDPMTIGVPGNVPYVITVGAFTDHYTPDNPLDDYVPAFSAAGPTVEGFVKPDVVAPGGHNISTMLNSTELATVHAEYRVDSQHFMMSGTSMATAAVSGAVALLLQSAPGLSPDQVKYRLMRTADPAVDGGGALAYSIFQQGAGRVMVSDAANSADTTSANQGLNVANDLSGAQHYGGPANRDGDGNYYIPEVSGYAWSGAYTWSNGYAWSNAYAWSGGYAWSNAYTWSGGYAWSNAYAWSNGYAWSAASLTNPAWVIQE